MYVPFLSPAELATDFLTYCRTHLKHQQATARPQLSAILQHPYFNQDFVTVHSFLTELPLKSATEKLHFFTHLPDRLRRFDEHNVAAQLVDLLLSRMVLIDPTAQLCVLPHLLSTRSDSNALAFFTAGTFQRYVVPRILQLFAVRETQTRLILLEYFRYYVRCVEEADLRDRLLPQLLLGIKDTNDVLVAATLRALAELVPLLGAATVIGRNRAPIFADGRPQAARQMSHGGGGNQNSRVRTYLFYNFYYTFLRNLCIILYLFMIRLTTPATVPTIWPLPICQRWPPTGWNTAR